MSKELAIIPFSDIEKMADAVAKSNLFGMKTKEQATALMLVAQAENCHPMIAARDYHIIDGRPSLKAEAMLTRFQATGGTVKWIDYTDQKVSAEFAHPSSPNPVIIDWTIERAKQAKLSSKDNWVKYPRAMMKARVISEGVKLLFPLATSGMYTPEEIQDFEPKEIKNAEIPENVFDVSPELIQPEPTPILSKKEVSEQKKQDLEKLEKELEKASDEGLDLVGDALKIDYKKCKKCGRSISENFGKNTFKRANDPLCPPHYAEYSRENR